MSWGWFNSIRNCIISTVDKRACISNFRIYNRSEHAQKYYELLNFLCYASVYLNSIVYLNRLGFEFGGEVSNTDLSLTSYSFFVPTIFFSIISWDAISSWSKKRNYHVSLLNAINIWLCSEISKLFHLESNGILFDSKLDGELNRYRMKFSSISTW